eukprot:NODE_4143_length_493_cov_33.896396_g3543_i0.p4 GENE.NODE_4143_length_493_cov_33.896396_g3543_i0~~NODE_4143_length_493_cov_33.896396_g3543_i0.p4  ORF type:complete len:73 (+),score=12.92 NODE_4143_length_493_cov_33.896396_g3543_i0:274-492(+)
MHLPPTQQQDSNKTPKGTPKWNLVTSYSPWKIFAKPSNQEMFQSHLLRCVKEGTVLRMNKNRKLLSKHLPLS